MDYSLTCPVCGKAAFRREERGGEIAYLHLGKGGNARHVLVPDKKPKKRGRKK